MFFLHHTHHEYLIIHTLVNGFTHMHLSLPRQSEGEREGR